MKEMPISLPPSPATDPSARSKLWRRRAVRRLVDNGAWMISAVALILFWDWIVVARDISPSIFPRPGAVWAAFWQNILDGTFIGDLRVTMAEIMAGFTIGSLVGIALALLTSEFRLVRAVLYPYVIAFQSMPKTALAPMFLIWFGFGIESKIAQVVLASFFPVVVIMMAGLSRIDPDQLDMMKAFCGTRWRVFATVKLPSALPSLFAGLELAIVFSLLSAVVAEYLGSTAGLGHRILQLNTNLEMAAEFAALILLSLVGFTLHAIVRAFSTIVIFWGKPRNDGVAI
jgi:NitT/TauT family transport system permease protein